EPAEPFDLLLGDVDAFHLCATRALATEVDDAFHRFRLSLERRLDGSVPAVRDPAGNASLLRHALHRVAEGHALDAAVDDDTAADHGAYSRGDGVQGDPQAAAHGPLVHGRADPTGRARAHRLQRP